MRTLAVVQTHSLFLILVSFVVMALACGPITHLTSTSVPLTRTAIPPTSTSVPLTRTAIPPTSTSVQPTPTPLAQCTVAASRGLNLRSGPGTAYPVLNALVRGEVLAPIARNTAGDWVAVLAREDIEGWVAVAFIDCNVTIDSLMTATPVAPPPTPVKHYPVPVLLSPEDGAQLVKGSHADLRWSWTGILEEDEYFDVRFWKDGVPHYGVAWTKEGFYPVEGEPGITYYWAIAVIRGQDGQMLEQLSLESEGRRLSWFKPAPTSTPPVLTQPPPHQ